MNACFPVTIEGGKQKKCRVLVGIILTNDEARRQRRARTHARARTQLLTDERSTWEEGYEKLTGVDGRVVGSNLAHACVSASRVDIVCVWEFSAG